MRIGFLVGQLIPSEPLIRRRDIALREPEILEDDIPRHWNSRRFVERQVTVESLPAKAAVGGKDQLVGRNIFQTASDPRGHHIWEVCLQLSDG